MVIDAPIYIPLNLDGIVKWGKILSFFDRITHNNFIYKRILLKKLKVKMDELYIALQGNLIVSRQYSKEIAKRELPRIKSALNVFTELMELLESINYVDDKALRTQTTCCLDLTYKIITELKKRAFSGERMSKTDEDFKQALALKSQEAIENSLYH